MPTATPLPQCDPRAAWLAQAADIDAAIRRVLENGRYILGAEVKAFESEFASALGFDFAIGVANGTDAIELALRALGVGEGDLVATVSNTAVATICAIRSAGASPRFVDVDPVHGLMDPSHLADVLDAVDRHGPGRVAAIIPVHLFGRCADMHRIRAIADPRGIAILEDCAQAHGASFDGQPAGTFGRAASFSFYPTKNLGAIGDGGAVACQDPALFERVRLLREYGWKLRYISAIEGTNSRLDELQAAILRVKLPKLADDNAGRRRIADRYRAGIRHPDVRLPAGSGRDGHVYHQFVIQAAGREALRRHLDDEGIGTLVHYPVPVHMQPAYADGAFAPLGLPVTEQLAERILSLPMYPQLSLESVDRVCEAINAWT